MARRRPPKALLREAKRLWAKYEDDPSQGTLAEIYDLMDEMKRLGDAEIDAELQKLEARAEREAARAAKKIRSRSGVRPARPRGRNPRGGPSETGVPDLERESGSWVVTSPSGQVVELFDRANAEKASAAGWRVETALQYRARLNREAKAARGARPSSRPNRTKKKKGKKGKKAKSVITEASLAAPRAMGFEIRETIETGAMKGWTRVGIQNGFDAYVSDILLAEYPTVRFVVDRDQKAGTWRIHTMNLDPQNFGIFTLVAANYPSAEAAVAAIDEGIRRLVKGKGHKVVPLTDTGGDVLRDVMPTPQGPSRNPDRSELKARLLALDDRA